MNVTRRRRETRKRSTEGKRIRYACNCGISKKGNMDTKLLYTKSGPRYGRVMGRIPNWKHPALRVQEPGQDSTPYRSVILR